jgi:Leucine-rich repeat (LRR) protein
VLHASLRDAVACAWGVGRGVGRDMSLNNLNGYLPDELGGLDQLTYLDFSSNGLKGTIPETLGGLEQLVWLNLNQNQLTGRIQEALGRGLKQLAWLDLSVNQIEGPVPKTLGDLEKLTNLDLNGNRLTGVVPSLPFENYTYCNLQAPIPTNLYTCPPPPVSPSRAPRAPCTPAHT